MTELEASLRAILQDVAHLGYDVGYAEAKNTNADVQISSREVTINLYVKALKDVIQSGGTRIHDE